MTMTTKTEFIRGFEQSTGMSHQEAAEQWEGFSRQLSDGDLEQVEAGGFESGVEQGQAFRKMFPTGE